MALQLGEVQKNLCPPMVDIVFILLRAAVHCALGARWDRQGCGHGVCGPAVPELVTALQGLS